MKRTNWGSYFDMMRDNFWMWVALWWTQPEPSAPMVENTSGGMAEGAASDLDFLFSEPTGNGLDFIDSNELYLSSADELNEFCNDNLVGDGFEHDYLDSDLDFYL